MPNLPKTPSRPARPRRCDGLIVQLAGGGSRSASLKRLQDAVRTSLKGEWLVTLINHGDRLYELVRTRPAVQPLLGQAFDLARSLEKHPAISFCEIGAVVPGIDPGIGQVYPAARGRAITKSSGGGRAACSDREEWALGSISVPGAWTLPLPPGGRAYGARITVAHPDTGHTMHPEFIHGGRVLFQRGYDFEDDDGDAADPLKGWNRGHGTATGSVILGTRGDQSPDFPHFVTGAAPAAELIPLRVSTGVVHLSFRRLVRAVYHAIDENAHVISMSLGGPFASNALRTAIDAAVARGIIVIAAAGNLWPFVVHPAKLDNVIAVAASDCRGRPWSDSARGREVDISAPGDSVWRARSKKSVTTPFVNERGSGTSYSAALTTGVCALWLAFHGRSRLMQMYGGEHVPAAFRRQLVTTAHRPPGWKTSRYGAGIVDAEELLGSSLPAKSEVLATAPVPKSTSGVAEVLELLPEASALKARTVLARTWGCEPGELGAAMRGYDQEFRYHLASNPELRTMILRRAMAKKPAGVSKKDLAKPGMLGKNASRGLKRKLGI